MVDYVSQFEDICDQLKGQAEATQQYWKDDVQERYYRDHLEPIETALSNYTKGSGFTGKNLKDLTCFITQKEKEMDRLLQRS